MNNTFNLMASSVGASMEATMDTFMVGSFALNAFVSVSMKQIMKAIRVLQIVSFFTLLEINYPPLSLMFMQAIYRFSTFKIVPKELMNKVLTILESDDDDSEDDLSSTLRNL